MTSRAVPRYAGFALGAALFLLAGFASAQNLVLNPSFETLGQASWTPVLNNAPGPVSWNDSGAAPPRTDGANGVFSNQGGPGSQILYQDIVLPQTGRYRISVEAGCVHAGLGVVDTANDFCRADVTTNDPTTIVAPAPGAGTLGSTGGNVIAPVLASDGLGTNINQSGKVAFFQGTAGQTVRVRFMVQATDSPQAILLDDVFLGLDPGVPTLSEWGILILAALLALVGMVYLGRVGRTRIG